MASDKRILELALKGLEAERDKIASEIEELRTEISGAARRGRRAAKAVGRKATKKLQRTAKSVKKKARKMTAAQKKALSKKMKAAWARRKAAG